MANHLEQPNFMSTDDKIKKNKAEVKEVLSVLSTNIQRVIERGDRLEDLHKRTNTLVNESTTFLNGSQQLKKKMWWQNAKVTIILGVIGIIILGIILWIIINSITSK